ncbi:Target SNARE coiled-coil homology domain [Fusarium oxysporum f. sp. vasinfectum]|nr:Target SNARE coiled-coil homology domain [Fusarium oxysporum f. sp. vasinfectum]
MSSANQLFLLADHIKLSLLERQRAKNLNLEGDSQDGHISRSFDQFRDGLANLRDEEQRLTFAGETDTQHPHLQSRESQRLFASATLLLHRPPSSLAVTAMIPSDSAGYRDEAQGMDNQQIHQYHAQILEQQDEQLDRLGESIGRQRELSMQIGDELDSHVAMLDEVEAVTDRHQSRLDRASRMLGKVARGASENKQMTTIVVLIIILVLLIAILK